MSPNTPAQTDSFLNVMQVMDGNLTNAQYPTEYIDDPIFDGVKIKDRIVMFSKNGDLVKNEFTYQTPIGSYKCLFADLQKGLWTISKNGIYQETINVLEDTNTYYFTSNGEKYRFAPAVTAKTVLDYNFQNAEVGQPPYGINDKYNPEVAIRNNSYVYTCADPKNSNNIVLDFASNVSVTKLNKNAVNLVGVKNLEVNFKVLFNVMNSKKIYFEMYNPVSTNNSFRDIILSNGEIRNKANVYLGSYAINQWISFKIIYRNIDTNTSTREVYKDGELIETAANIDFANILGGNVGKLVFSWYSEQTTDINEKTYLDDVGYIILDSPNNYYDVFVGKAKFYINTTKEILNISSGTAEPKVILANYSGMTKRISIAMSIFDNNHKMLNAIIKTIDVVNEFSGTVSLGNCNFSPGADNLSFIVLDQFSTMRPIQINQKLYK